MLLFFLLSLYANIHASCKLLVLHRDEPTLFSSSCDLIRVFLKVLVGWSNVFAREFCDWLVGWLLGCEFLILDLSMEAC